MFKPVEMCKVNLLVLNRHVAELTNRLGKMEVMHLVDANEQSSRHLLKSQEAGDTHLLNQLSGKCSRLIRQLNIPDGSEKATELPIQKLKERLNEIDRQYGENNRELSELLTRVNNAKQALWEDNPADQESLQDVADEENARQINAKGKLAEGIQESAKADGEPQTESLEELQGNLALCKEKMSRLANENASELRAMKSQIEQMEMMQDIQGHFGHLKRLTCISGWIPKSELDAVKAVVAEVTEETGMVQVVSASKDARVRLGKEKVPTKMNGNAFTRPFQMLVSNFGMPAYNEIDPSLFFGISFVLLFGYMFGDIGQGLVLALVGLWAKFTKREFGKAVRDAGMLLMMCGLCAICFGFAYGSVFGYEHLFDSLWVNPMKSSDVAELLLTAVGVGTVFISIAIIFNIINHIRAKRLFDGTVERFGIVGLLFFWFCLFLGAWLMSGHEFSKWMLVPLALPLVLIFVREPLHNALHHHGLFQGGFIGVFLECCIGVMETLTGYFSSTVSFVRVGAFAISHAALCFAVFTLAGMMSNVAFGGLLKILIIVLGNILVICFEGMVAMIQCVRLEYYELFGKYFQGDGIPYSPFCLKKQEQGN
ncbi:MAG: hypothetical protein J6X55_13215 [Victivallales bacterium]|nr:hypothetical protein [Victivallales bacterium]